MKGVVMFQLYHMPRTVPDIRMDPFRVFANTLVCQWPEYFAAVLPHDQGEMCTYLRRDLGLNPLECGMIVHGVRRYYGLHGKNELLRAWVEQKDVTLGELHRRLWHEANCHSADHRIYASLD